MKNKRIRAYAQVFFAAAVVGVSAMGCSHSALDLPEGTVIVDRTHPKHTIVEFNGACPAGEARKMQSQAQGNQEGFVTEDGKVYYFSSNAERDRFVQNYTANSRY